MQFRITWGGTYSAGINEEGEAYYVVPSTKLKVHTVYLGSQVRSIDCDQMKSGKEYIIADDPASAPSGSMLRAPIIVEKNGNVVCRATKKKN